MRQSPPACGGWGLREGLASAALYRVPVRQTGPYLSAHASVPEAGGHHLKLPAPPALEPQMGIFPLRPLGHTARHRVHTRVHTSNAHSTRPPPRLHLSASTSFHCRLASNPPVRHPCLPLSSLVVLLVDPLLHRFLALDFTILKAWDYWEAPPGSLRYSWGWRCWRVELLTNTSVIIPAPAYGICRWCLHTPYASKLLPISAQAKV